MGLEESDKMVGEDSAAKAVRQAGVAGGVDTHESGRSRVAVLVLLALSFALGCTEFTIMCIYLLIFNLGNLTTMLAPAFANAA